MFHGERGQVAPLLALLAVGVGVAGLALGRFGADAVDHARARTAADAAALAGAEGAARLAAANGAVVESVEAAGADVRVRVRTGVATASARARHPRPRTPATAAPGEGLAPVVRAALARAAQVLGEPVPVTSGFRSAADQRRLWAGRAANRYPVAPPGTSMHERGLAVDVPLALADRLAAVSARTGLCRPYPTADPVHFEPCATPPVPP
jgi:D-alanyl-D-alanine dipeptidase